MRIFTYDEMDELHARLTTAKRTDLQRYVPLGGSLKNEATIEFWTDVAAAFADGRTADAITSIERRFEPRQAKETDAVDVVAARTKEGIAA